MATITPRNPIQNVTITPTGIAQVLPVFLLNEDGTSYILQEDGFKIIIGYLLHTGDHIQPATWIPGDML